MVGCWFDGAGDCAGDPEQPEKELAVTGKNTDKITCHPSRLALMATTSAATFLFQTGHYEYRKFGREERFSSFDRL
jgi:hypothetical protein